MFCVYAHGSYGNIVITHKTFFTMFSYVNWMLDVVSHQPSMEDDGIKIQVVLFL